jgi:hypothetical protein
MHSLLPCPAVLACPAVLVASHTPFFWFGVAMDVLNKVAKTSRLSADRCLVAMLLLVGSVLDLQRGRKQQ